MPSAPPSWPAPQPSWPAPAPSWQQPPPQAQFHSRSAAQPARPRTIATLTQRAGAGAIDVLIVAAIALPLHLVIGMLLDLAIGATDGRAAVTESVVINAVNVLVIGLTWLVMIGSCSARTGARRGQTLGHQALGIGITSRTTGDAITSGKAWWRATAQTATLTAVIFFPRLLDLIPDFSPYGWIAGSIGFCVMAIATTLAALAGGERRMFHDRLSGTVIATAGFDAPQPQKPTGRTYGLTILACLTLAAAIGAWSAALVGDNDNDVVLNGSSSKTTNSASQSASSSAAQASRPTSPASGAPNSAGGSTDEGRARRIMAEPDNTLALERVGDVETYLKDCLPRYSAVECDILVPSRVRHVPFIDITDLDLSNPRDRQATVGRVATAPSEDGSIYVFSDTDDRSWATKVLKDVTVDRLDRNCLDLAGNTCDGIYDWPGWND